jgi:hypothetical protein
MQIGALPCWAIKPGAICAAHGDQNARKINDTFRTLRLCSISSFVNVGILENRCFSSPCGHWGPPCPRQLRALAALSEYLFKRLLSGAALFELGRADPKALQPGLGTARLEALSAGHGRPLADLSEVGWPRLSEGDPGGSPCRPVRLCVKPAARHITRLFHYQILFFRLITPVNSIIRLLFFSKEIATIRCSTRTSREIWAVRARILPNALLIALLSGMSVRDRFVSDCVHHHRKSLRTRHRAW